MKIELIKKMFKNAEIFSQEENIAAFISPAHLPPDMQGWGNGYVAVTKEHPWFEVDYDSIDANIHGGLTYGSGFPEESPEIWVVGFDTAHYRDGLARWPKEAVIGETRTLLEQAKNAQSYTNNQNTE